MPFRTLPCLLLLTLSSPVHAQNMAPELFIDGSCDDIIAWASQPADALKPELDRMLGTDGFDGLSPDMGKMILQQIKHTKVSDQWFAKKCTFSDDELEAMAPLQDAYVRHFSDMITE